MDRRQLLIVGGGLAVVGGGAALQAVAAMGSLADYTSGISSLRAPLPIPVGTRDLLRYATLAASGHNTQPWRFRVRGETIQILPDPGRRTPVVDPDDHHMFVSLGCAAENLSLAAAARGIPGDVRFNPDQGGSLEFISRAGPPTASVLFDAIPHRQSTRADFDGRPVSAADLRSLAAAAVTPGVDLVLVTDRPRMNQVRDLVLAGNSAQLADDSFLRELRTWIRFSPRQALQTGDGLFAVSSGNPALPDWLGPLLLPLVLRADTDNDKYARQIGSSGGLAIFVSEQADKDHWVRAGRACQRFALQATALGLKVAFLNQPVEVARLRPELAALAGLPGRRPDLVMRFGRGPTLPFSARRPVASVMA